MVEQKKKKMDTHAEELHTPERFEKYHAEWLKYHDEVAHPITGEPTSIQELLGKELETIVKEELKDVKTRVKETDARDEGKIRKEVMEIAKKAYMASHGMTKEPTGKDKKQLVDQNVENFITSVASQAAKQQFNTVDEVIAEIMSAHNPVYGEGEKQRSAIFDALLQAYAGEVHEGKSDITKGLSMKRQGYLRQQLSSQYHDKHWREAHRDIFPHYLRDAKFKDTATGTQVMQTVEDLLNTSDTRTRRTYIDAKSHTRKEGPVGKYKPHKVTK